MRWFKALFAWKVVHDTGVHEYLENAVTGRRDFRRKPGRTGFQPLNLNWLMGGDWDFKKPKPRERVFTNDLLSNPQPKEITDLKEALEIADRAVASIRILAEDNIHRKHADAVLKQCECDEAVIERLKREYI